jgi:Rha family phage regulatory protein
MSIVRYGELQFFLDRESVRVSSQAVAQAFGKKHYNVIRDIRELLAMDSPELADLFKESKYIAENSKPNTEYVMTRDGFLLLVMGYKTEKAMDIKLRFLKAFNSLLDDWKKSHKRALVALYRNETDELLADILRPAGLGYDEKGEPESLTESVARLERWVR